METAETTSTNGMIGNLGGKLIKSLPAQFLMLCVLNSMFIGGLLWFLDRRDEARERLLTPVLTACLRDVPADILHQLLEKRP